jgi:hypothetical protein
VHANDHLVALQQRAIRTAIGRRRLGEFDDRWRCNRRNLFARFIRGGLASTSSERARGEAGGDEKRETSRAQRGHTTFV